MADFDPGRRAMIAATPVLLGLAMDDGMAAQINLNESALASLAKHPFLSAADFGINGRGEDETQKVQAFLDSCAAAGARVAYFGGMRIKISGPLYARSVGIVFDRQSYGVSDPGFYVTGSGYTALTVTGLIPDFNAAIYGAGGVEYGSDGRITKDTRPRVNGFQFGHPDEKEPLLMSFIRHARTYKLSGFGIRHTICYDCTFIAESVEECGNDRHYAFEISGSDSGNCNESVWVRVQVELSANRAMSIHPNTLMCLFAKIHSERSTAVSGTPTWQLAGACEFGSVRIHAQNAEHASMIIVSAQAECRNFRIEGGIPVAVNATGGVVNFHNANAVLLPVPNQNGQINVIGGTVQARSIGPGWTFLGTRLDLLEVGFMPPGSHSMAIGCRIGSMLPQPGTADGEMVLQGSRASGSTVTATGRLRHLQLLAGSTLTADSGALTVADQTVTVDATSRIKGRVTVRQATLNLWGRIEGDLVIEGTPQSIAGTEAMVTGRVVNWNAPVEGGRLGPIANGTHCKNLSPRRTSVNGMAAVISGWFRAEGAWLPVTIAV